MIKFQTLHPLISNQFTIKVILNHIDIFFFFRKLYFQIYIEVNEKKPHVLGQC